ncbi:MAG: NAD(+) synthase [Bacteroidales bacterium]|nr:NAD(+) synthase [Bacteroidales bacterium]
MDNYGFIRVAAFSPRVFLAQPELNTAEIVRLAAEAAGRGVSVAVFPELCVCGYTCADLFAQQNLLDASEKAVLDIAKATAASGMMVAVGAPLRIAGRLYNCSFILKGGKVLGIVPKTYLPNAAEFYEMRWFASATELKQASVPFGGEDVPIGVKMLFRLGPAVVGVEICQDLWVPVPPSSYAALAGANLILNLSASNEALCKHDYRKLLVSSTSARLNAAYVYCSCGYGESTTDLVWAGSSLIYENGSLLAENERFSRESTAIYADVDVQRLDGVRARNVNFRDDYDGGESSGFSIIDAGSSVDTDFGGELLRNVEAHPFVPGGDPEALAARCREILSIQVLALCNRLEFIGCKTAVLGISGGLDSTLALLVTVLAADKLGWERSRIVGVTMPGFGTTARTKGNAEILMERLGITSRCISIVPAAKQHLDDIGHDISVHDTTYENAQARERTQILMDLAGELGGIVVGTGDLSELALGWCTYNGDHMSMYGVNASIPKTLVRTLVKFAADCHFDDCGDVLYDIIDTPISPELLPGTADGKILQVTEDVVGPYELHDFFLYNVMRWGFVPEKVLLLARKAFEGVYTEEVIRKWLRVFYRRFFAQQFKRSCMPDGPKVGSVSLSPRGDWRMPSDAYSALWTKDL